MPLFILSVCVRVCDIEFVVFSDCESCARPISTNPVPMEAGEYGLSRGTWFHLPSRGGRGRWADVGLVMCFFFLFSMSLNFQIRARVIHDRRLRENQSSQQQDEGTPTASQSAH